jgi:hypothetical protein
VNPFADRLVSALAGLVGLSLLVSACGGSPGSHDAQLAPTTPAPSAQLSSALDFSRCMRSHGVPSFPDPDPDGNVPSSALRALGVPKQMLLATDEACRHLLPRGGAAGTQGDQKKLDFALKAARCMRRHGFPTYPDPPNSTSTSQGSGTRFEGTGIDTKSPRFQKTETGCETQARKALGLP